MNEAAFLKQEQILPFLLASTSAFLIAAQVALIVACRYLLINEDNYKVILRDLKKFFYTQFVLLICVKLVGFIPILITISTSPLK